MFSSHEPTDWLRPPAWKSPLRALKSYALFWGKGLLAHKLRLHSCLAVTRQGVLQRLAWHLTVMSLILTDNRSVRPVLMASCLVIQQHPLRRAGDPVTHTQTQSFNTKLQTSSVSLRCLPAAGEAAGYELSFTGTNGKKCPSAHQI